MTQRIENKVLDNFNAQLENSNIKNKPRITHGEQTRLGWTSQIVDRVSISQLASENGIDVCPKCNNYSVNFDDGRGFFCCQGYPKCNFNGNIVDFMRFIQEGCYG